jgi:hypothetical protein
MTVCRPRDFKPEPRHSHQPYTKTDFLCFKVRLNFYPCPPRLTRASLPHTFPARLPVANTLRACYFRRNKNGVAEGKYRAAGITKGNGDEKGATAVPNGQGPLVASTKTGSHELSRFGALSSKLMPSSVASDQFWGMNQTESLTMITTV